MITKESSLLKEARHKYNNITDTEFRKWLKSLSIKDRLDVWKHLGIGIYKYNISIFELISKFMPSEVSHTKYHGNGDIIVHEFRFEITKFDSHLKMTYSHFAESYLNKEEGGLTNVWCNPFEGNHACDYLIWVQFTKENYQEAFIKVYEFLVENDIEFSKEENYEIL